MTILLISLSRESGKDRQVFRDRAKDIVIFRNIDPDLALTYTETNYVPYSSNLLNAKQNLIYNDGEMPTTLFDNRESPWYSTQSQGNWEVKAAKDLEQLLILDTELKELKNAALLKDDQQRFRDFIALELEGLFSRVGHGTEKINYLGKQSEIILLTQVIHLILQTLARGEMITKNQSKPIQNDLLHLIELVHGLQLDTMILGLRAEGKLCSYEGLRIVKEKKHRF
jgi:hypothetical protein